MSLFIFIYYLLTTQPPDLVLLAVASVRLVHMYLVNKNKKLITALFMIILVIFVTIHKIDASQLMTKDMD